MASNSLANHIIDTVTSYITAYNKLIDAEFGIGNDELLPLWRQVIGVSKDCGQSTTPPSTPQSTPPSTPPPAPTKATPPPAPKKKRNEKKVAAGCPYVFTKGAKEGQNCGSKAKGNGTYCSRHKKYEGLTPKTKKPLPPPRRSIVSTKRKNTSKKKHPETVLYKGPGDMLYHRPTGMVFGTDKVAIGTWLRADDNSEGIDKIIPLTDKDIEVAKKNMFAFRLEEVDRAAEAVRKVTTVLKGSEAKELQQSLTHAITSTNAKAEDVAEILCELQSRGSLNSLDAEKVDDESEYEEELEEELEEEE